MNHSPISGFYKYALLSSLAVFWLATAFQTPGESVSLWIWLLIFIVLFGGVALLGYLDRRGAADRSPAVEPPQRNATLKTEPDDLVIIEGIGPKIAASLRAAGITTFNHLAGADETHIREILERDGIRLFDSSTWAEQARLAAAGDFAALKSLQEDLRAGRRA